MKATSSSEAKALSSTRSDKQELDLLLGGAVLAQVRGDRVVAGVVRHFLGLEPVDVLQPQPEVDELRRRCAKV